MDEGPAAAAGCSPDRSIRLIFSSGGEAEARRRLAVLDLVIEGGRLWLRLNPVHGRSAKAWGGAGVRVREEERRHGRKDKKTGRHRPRLLARWRDGGTMAADAPVMAANVRSLGARRTRAQGGARVARADLRIGAHVRVWAADVSGVGAGLIWSIGWGSNGRKSRFG